PATAADRYSDPVHHRPARPGEAQQIRPELDRADDDPGGADRLSLLAILLIWLFNARPLEDSPLRQRLEAICRRCGLRYRNIMLWQTDFSMANAAVIGVLP